MKFTIRSNGDYRGAEDSPMPLVNEFMEGTQAFRICRTDGNDRRHVETELTISTQGRSFALPMRIEYMPYLSQVVVTGVSLHAPERTEWTPAIQMVKIAGQLMFELVEQELQDRLSGPVIY